MEPVHHISLFEIGEFALIEKVVSAANSPLPANAIGPGDDGAVLPAELLAEGERLVVTTDVMIDGRHFSSEWGPPEDLGWKILAVNLSDLAAMGARPLGFTLTMQLSKRSWVDEILRIASGLGELARESFCPLLGGDMVECAERGFGITAFGAVRHPLLRSAARVGDDLWVSGQIGGGGTGLRWFSRRISPPAHEGPSLMRMSHAGGSTTERFLRPVPRLTLGRLLSEEGLAACALDVSDGLVQDAGHIAERSGVTVVIALADVPRAFGVLPWVSRTTPEPGRVTEDISLVEAITSGDDYELLFTAPQEKRAALESIHLRGGDIPPCTRIGAIETKGASPVLLRLPDGGVKPAEEVAPRGGYSHFSSNR